MIMTSPSGSLSDIVTSDWIIPVSCDFCHECGLPMSLVVD